MANLTPKRKNTDTIPEFFPNKINKTVSKTTPSQFSQPPKEFIKYDLPISAFFDIDNGTIIGNSCEFYKNKLQEMDELKKEYNDIQHSLKTVLDLHIEKLLNVNQKLCKIQTETAFQPDIQYSWNMNTETTAKYILLQELKKRFKNYKFNNLKI
ncbi:MAG: hypothetical protein Edafosvirus3_41 [Edafosvirus sp.]|uniref:Uncharacterized protein n=1 Tax=Edafosvirus sp. TaxID=2487765 RepID=A0A3G4ZWI6_9VIRU|nr:MAG: hypothetical protein Edafosvirus3_41 [Edafosvirus sp.]